jgi:4-hydroxy-3-polyprenylbenzoate decarboxylase
MTHKRVVAAITGASGAAYAVRLLKCLAGAGVEIHLVISPHGRQLLSEELDIAEANPQALVGAHADRLTLYAYQDLGCRLASGSFTTDGMVICPCSSNTLGAIAAGLGDNLIRRAAAVTLKQARRLILVPREMPLSPIDIEGMLAISRAGGIICPAAPAFYLRPKRVEDLIDFVAGRVLDLLGIEHDLPIRWDKKPGTG